MKTNFETEDKIDGNKDVGRGAGEAPKSPKILKGSECEKLYNLCLKPSFSFLTETHHYI